MSPRMVAMVAMVREASRCLRMTRFSFQSVSEYSQWTTYARCRRRAMKNQIPCKRSSQPFGRGIRMERRRLGKPDMDVSVLGFGGSEIGYHRVSQRTVERLLGSALDAGLNVIDTAECYDNSEELIGRAVGARSRDFHLFTKCGHARGEWRADWRPEALLRSIERSLERLRTDRVDLVQLHSCSLDVLRRGDAITALETARSRG